MNITRSRLLKFSFIFFLVLGISFFVSSLTSVSADVCTWTGLSDNRWGTSGNWDGCTTPSNGDDLVFPFPNDGEVYVLENDMSAGLEVNGIFVGWDLYEFFGNSINLRGDFQFDDDDDGGTLVWEIDMVGFFDYINFQVVDPNSSLQISADISGTADVYKQNDGRLILSGNNTYNGNTFIQNGYVRLTSSGAFQNTIVECYNGCTIELENDITINTTLLKLDGGGVDYGFDGALRNLSGTNTWESDIDMPFDVTYFNVISGLLTLSGEISGSSDFVKTGSDPLLLNGSTGNSYTGITYIDDGVLRLNKSSGLAVPSTSIVIGDEDGDTESAWLVIYDDDQFNSSAFIDVYSDGILAAESDWQTNNIADLYLHYNGRANLVGATNITDSLQIEGGSLRTYFNNIVISADTLWCIRDNDLIGEIVGDPFTFNGEVFISSNSDSEDNCDISSVIQGSDDIYIDGRGIKFNAANTFTGGVIITENGQLRVRHSSALGNTSTGTSVEAGGVLQLENNITIATEPLNISGTGSGFSGALASGLNSNTYAGPIILTGTNVMISTNGDAVLTLTGAMSGSLSGYLGFIKFNPGDGVIQLGSANTFSASEIRINDGQVRKTASVNVFPDTLNLYLNQWGSLNLNSFSETVGSLNNENSNSVITLGNATLSVGSNNGTSTFSGVISGNGGVSKVGTGTFTLTANNNYTGTTTVAAGRLNVNGQQQSSAVTLSGTGVLGGTGRVGVITGGGTGGISPGTSPGILNVTGNVVFANTNSFNVEINGTTVGSQYDQLNVTGAVNLNSATLNVSLGMSTTTGQTFTIVQTSSALVGTFNGLPNNATFTVGGTLFRINYGTNSVVLTVTTGGTGNDGGGGGGGGLSDTGIAIPLAALAFLASITAVVVFGNKYLQKKKRFNKIYR